MRFVVRQNYPAWVDVTCSSRLLNNSIPGAGRTRPLRTTRSQGSLLQRVCLSNDASTWVPASHVVDGRTGLGIWTVVSVGPSIELPT
jgi:hypothetical protein